MATTALDEAFAALTAAVAAEREAAGTLAYRLTTVRLLLEAGEPQLLAEGLAELELATARLEAAGRRRGQARDDLCGPLALQHDRATLAQLIARAPRPWNSHLSHHRDALREAFVRIGRDAAADRERAQAALDEVRGRLGLRDPSRHLEAVPAPGELRLADDLHLASVVTELRVREVTYESIVGLTADPLPDELVAFVGTGRSTALTSPSE